MAGNVWEWTASLHRNYLYQADDGREDLSVDGARVLRGGAFDYTQRLVRCAFRYGFFPFLRHFNVGFRVLVAPGV
jgi:formylglycine-generating enzyme required for sulfatase activity